MKSIQSYKSIDELQEQAKIWMLSPCRVLNDIDDIEVINFYVASSILINQRLRELANLMGIEGFTESEIVCFSPHSLHNRAWACCSRSGAISVSIVAMLSVESLDFILIHELCHIVYQNHKTEFWSFFESNLKNLGYIDMDYDGWNKRFDKCDNKWDSSDAYDVNHRIFRGSCTRRIALLKYKIFRKGYHAGLLLFHDCRLIKAACSVYSSDSGQCHCYCNQLIVRNNI